MSDHTPTPKKRKINYGRLIPVILAVLILAMVVFGIIQLARWSKGREFIINENLNLDTEPEDYVFLMDPTLAEDNAYDGSYDILILGNDTAAYDKGGTNIGDIIQEETGANVYNCALTGSFMCTSTEYETILSDNPLDAFSLFWISHGIQINEWSLQESALELLPEEYDKEHYREVLDLLESIDYDSIDLLLIYYDGHDYLAKHPINNPLDMYDVQSIEGNFTGIFERFPHNYPHMQYMFISPTFCYVTHEDGTREGSDTADLGYGNLPTNMTTLQVQSQNYTVSYVDNYCGINITPETADGYLMEDGITPNKTARKMIADRIAGFIAPRMPK